MKGIYITVSGVNKDTVNMVLADLRRLIHNVGIGDVGYYPKFANGELKVEENKVILEGTNDVRKIQLESPDFFTFNIDVMDKVNETTESISAVWRTCPTSFPRQIVNVGTESETQSDIHQVIKEIGNWIKLG